MQNEASRPTMFTAGAAVAAILSPTRAKGPPVWLDMDQEALDAAYDQQMYAPNRDQIGRRRVVNSEQTRAILGAPLRMSYGPTEIEALDVYRTKAANAPVNVFVHGGAWRANRAADYGYLAEPFVNAGAHFVVLDFISVDEAGGSLFPMAEQVRRAIAFVYRNAKSFGGDPDRLYLSSHSSGSHLVRLRRDPRLGEGGAAARHPQGRDAQQRHVRSQAGAALQALEIRQVHRRDGAGAQRAAPSRQARDPADPRLRHLRDPGVPAPDARLRGGGARRRQAGRTAGRATATITSRCWRRSAIPTACSAARCWRRWGCDRRRRNPPEKRAKSAVTVRSGLRAGRLVTK